MALTDYLFEAYDVPKSSISGQVSASFAKFVTDVFVYYGRDGISVDGLSPAEIVVAKDLVRRNLHLRYSHLLQAAAALRDTEAVPALDELLAKETEVGYRSQIARCLFDITNDPRYEQASREWDELGSERRLQLLAGNAEYQAALRTVQHSMQQQNVALEQAREEARLENRRATRHARTVMIFTLGAFALIAVSVWFLVAR